MGFFEWVALYVLCFFAFASLVECCRRLAVKEVHIYYHTVKNDDGQERREDEEDIPSSASTYVAPAPNPNVWTRMDT